MKSQVHERFSPERSFLYYWTMTWKFISTRDSRVSGVKGHLSQVRSQGHGCQSCPGTLFACWCGRGNGTLATMAWSSPGHILLFQVLTQPALWKHTGVCKREEVSTWKDEGKHTAISRKSLPAMFPGEGWQHLVHPGEHITELLSETRSRRLKPPSYLPRR